jgi:hypothetical protein
MPDDVTHIMPVVTDINTPYRVKAYPVDISVEPEMWPIPDLKAAVFLGFELACKHPWHRVEVSDIWGRHYALFNSMWDFTPEHGVRRLVDDNPNSVA